MAFYSPFKERLAFLRHLTPSQLKKLAGSRMDDLVESEGTRSKKRVEELVQRYPSASPRELAQRLVDHKKSLASAVGGASGVLGLASVPLDWVAMVYLQLSLLCDVATTYKANLKTDRARREVLDLFGYANGIGPMQRAGPKLVGTVAGTLLRKGGLELMGKALPLIAAPISAHINSLHIQQVGDEAVRHYEGFVKAREKTRKASNA